MTPLNEDSPISNSISLINGGTPILHPGLESRPQKEKNTILKHPQRAAHDAILQDCNEWRLQYENGEYSVMVGVTSQAWILFPSCLVCWQHARRGRGGESKNNPHFMSGKFDDPWIIRIQRWWKAWIRIIEVDESWWMGWTPESSQRLRPCYGFQNVPLAIKLRGGNEINPQLSSHLHSQRSSFPE